MSKEICISSTPHETRLAILEDDQLSEIYYERENEYTLAGSIYKGRVTRVLPGMQSAFVDLGLERDAFLYVTDFLEEQGDAADFEGIGSSQPSREREPRREAQPVREEDAEGAGEAHAHESASGERAPEGTRRWRGRRGRRGRDGRPQSGRDGNAHIESPEAIEESISAEPVALPEHGAPGGIPASNFASPASQSTPILLPGESLSKYGGQPAATEQKASVSTAPARANFTSKPSTLIEGPIEWDGGMLLPGESRSLRRQRGEGANVPAGEAAAIVPPVPVVEETEAREAFPEAVVPEEHVTETASGSEHLQEGAQGASTEAEVEPKDESVPESAAAVEAIIEPVPLIHEEEQPERIEIVEEDQEYEPEHASASHRVDAVAPSEYRLSSVDEEVEAREHAAPVEEAAHAAEPVQEVVYESEFVTEPEFITEEVTEIATDLPAVSEPVFVEEYQEEEAAEPSEAVAPEAAETELDSENDRKFAPGAGLLEEEVIDEEEYDFEPIHAHADEHDLEDLEEQTLDQAINEADLGAMVRDLHINQRLNFGPEGALAEQAEEDAREFGEDLDEDEEELEDEAGEDEVSADAQASPEQTGQTEGRRQDYRDRRRSGRGRHGRRRQGGGGPRRASAQVTDLPVITELLKPGQEILVQIAKEPIAKKGARITSHIALPGRFLVFMPTVNHVGVSRKISSDEERQRLKRILIHEKGTASGGFIVRTAAATATEDELRADLRFLISLWNDIKQRSDDGKAPALIYHDLNLVERVLRDQVSDNFSTIWVDSETEYERVVRFLNRFQPSLVRRVKLYTKDTPLFEQFGIQDEITKALRSKVWLKSGGSIVINQTEALVAIDINTGKYVGKTARLEDTILKTNLDAIPEIVRQIRLRDLGGIIVIDFIDMDERKNRYKVMQALEEALKADRAPSKVLQFNDFGLVAITRKRVKQSLERTLSVPCEICQGTGMVKSPMTVCNEIYIEMRKMQKHLERNDVLLRVNPEVVKTLKANNARWLNEIEEMIGKTIIVKSDPALHPEQFDIH